jgi:hypothetical protein
VPGRLEPTARLEQVVTVVGLTTVTEERLWPLAAAGLHYGHTVTGTGSLH